MITKAYPPGKFPAITIREAQDSAYGPPTKVFHPGMSLRAYFAAKAMAALVSSPHCPRQSECIEGALVAQIAVSLADILIKELEK